MPMENNLVPEPQASILEAVRSALGDDRLAGQVAANPRAAGSLIAADCSDREKKAEESIMEAVDTAVEERSSDACNSPEVAIDNEHAQESRHNDGAARSAVDKDDTEVGEIPLTAVDDIGRATAADVREALHQVIDPELGIDVVDLGLVYGIEVDEQSRAIITMTLTTPACPLTDLIEDECASTLAGLVDEFRIDWTWQPRWTTDMIRPEGRDQLIAIGFNFDNMPTY